MIFLNILRVIKIKNIIKSFSWFANELSYFKLYKKGSGFIV